MSHIDAALVKELRNRTGAGMMDCKRALSKSEGDMNQAIQLLREKGLSEAVRKDGRQTREGLVYAFVSSDGGRGVLIEINCETDFVAKNATYQKFVEDIANLVLVYQPLDVDQLGKITMSDGQSVEEATHALVHTFGENISIRRFVRYEVFTKGVIATYIHGDFLTDGKIGVLMELSVQKDETLSNSEFKVFLRSLLLHVAAMNPLYVRRQDIPITVVEREQSIFHSQAIQEGRPSEMVTGLCRRDLIDGIRNRV